MKKLARHELSTRSNSIPRFRQSAESHSRLKNWTLLSLHDDMFTNKIQSHYQLCSVRAIFLKERKLERERLVGKIGKWRVTKKKNPQIHRDENKEGRKKIGKEETNR